MVRCGLLLAMRLVLLLMGLLVPLAAQVKFELKPDGVAVAIDGQPFTTFYYRGEAPKPYLHPLTTAGGKRITRAFPMEQAAGETHDHPHHRGLWFTHGDVNGFDFWMNEKSTQNGKKGVIANARIVKLSEGRKQGLISFTADWQSPQGQTLLKEKRFMTFYAGKEERVIDLDVTFTAVEKVTFGDTKEGFFALRLRDELSESKGTGTLVNAEGKSTMKQVWGARSPWVDYSGQLENEAVGVAIFDHPSNPKHPTYWHARDYGLFAANPFGEHDFLNDKSRDGSVTLNPGQSLRFRFRVLIHSGDNKAAGIAGKYEAYAAGK
jgi:hypothetical protein